LDTIINGENAATQASLCDLVSQIKDSIAHNDEINSSKEQEGDAVLFQDWIDREGWIRYDPDKTWCKDVDDNFLTTEQLYQLYLKNKNL
jgi:hypothetical protein